MSNTELVENIKTAIVEGIPENAVKSLRAAIEAQIDYKTILNEAIIKAAGEVGELYEKEEYFIADMLMSGDAINSVMEILTPIIKEQGTQETSGIVLIGTAEGDIHDIGKSLMVSLLAGQGFEVIDLGVDVPAQKFIDEANISNPDIIGLSGLLTGTISKMHETIMLLKKEGIQSKIIVGGGILSQETCDLIGADDFAKDGWEGVKKIKNLIKGG